MLIFSPEYLKGHDRNVIQRAGEHAREQGVFTFTSVTVQEIVVGLELKNAASQLQKALAWMEKNEQVTPTAADYVEAAISKAAARKQGSRFVWVTPPVAVARQRLQSAEIPTIEFALTHCLHKNHSAALEQDIT